MTLGNYWLDNYGDCQNPPKQCKCLQEGPWLGEGCLYWIPLGVKSLEEYEKYVREKYVRL